MTFAPLWCNIIYIRVAPLEESTMKCYSKKQLHAISYAKQAKQRSLEEKWLKDNLCYAAYKEQTKYKTMRGYINYLTNGKDYEVIK